MPTKVFEQHTLRDRAEARKRFEAAHPRGPLHGLMSLGVEEVMLEDKRGRPIGKTSTVEHFVRRTAPLQVVAQRVNGGPVVWFHRDTTPSGRVDPKSYGLLKRRSRRGEPRSEPPAAPATVEEWPHRKP